VPRQSKAQASVCGFVNRNVRLSIGVNSKIRIIETDFLELQFLKKISDRQYVVSYRINVRIYFEYILRSN
jgi:hypothetical protein